MVPADPPWEYTNRGMKKHGASKAHFVEQPADQMTAVPVRDWADPAGCVLLLAARSMYDVRRVDVDTGVTMNRTRMDIIYG